MELLLQPPPRPPSDDSGEQHQLVPPQVHPLTVSFLHAKNPDETSPQTTATDTKLRGKGAPQEEFSVDHVLTKRHRREKLNHKQAEPRNTELAVKLLHKASVCGNLCAQYQLGLCLHRGGGRVRSNLKEDVDTLSISSSLLIMSEFFFLEQAKWYMKVAEGGYVYAMFNISLCFSFGEGLTRNHQLARKWMKRAADRGHSKAQFEDMLSFM
ncbi:F-box protein [Glycine max]|nr:F-box protein [Glycine max]